MQNLLRGMQETLVLFFKIATLLKAEEWCPYRHPLTDRVPAYNPVNHCSGIGRRNVSRLEEHALCIPSLPFLPQQHTLGQIAPAEAETFQYHRVYMTSHAESIVMVFHTA